MTLEMKGIAGTFLSLSATAATNSSTIGAIRAEWNARDVANGLQRHALRG